MKLRSGEPDVRGYFYGSSTNGIPFARFGSGEKDLLLFFGGPGNSIPKGFGLRMMMSGLNALRNDYSIYIVTRKSGLDKKCSTKDLSDDYAELIQQDFNGHVDLVIGMSFGAMIAQHFAVDHADLFDHIVIVMAAHKMTNAGKRLDVRFAELLSKGKNGKALALFSEVMFPREPMKTISALLLRLFGRMMSEEQSDTFAEDVLIEAQAEINHDSEKRLRHIEVPILIVCGDKDYYFPLSYIEEMAQLIPKSELTVYRGKGHGNLFGSQFVDVLKRFIKNNPR